MKLLECILNCRSQLLHWLPEFARRGVAGDDLVIADARFAFLVAYRVAT